MDAGAYGATNGDRILRFLINANPLRERVWATKGDFRSVFARHAERAGFTGPNGHVGRLDKNTFDHLLSGLIRTLSAAVPLAKVLDYEPLRPRDEALSRLPEGQPGRSRARSRPTSRSASRPTPPGWCSPTA